MSRLGRIAAWTGAAVVAVVAVMVLAGWWEPGLLILGFYAAVFVVLLVIERARYKPLLDSPPGPGWRASDERFVDPESGRLVTVWQDPASGRRAYVAGPQTEPT